MALAAMTNDEALDAARSGYSSVAIANEFIVIARRDAVSDATPMKLQKLVYLAHGWHLANFGSPLISDEVQAWRYGPVIPPLYHELKEHGGAPLTALIEPVYLSGFWIEGEAPRVGFDDEKAQAIIEGTWRQYGTLSPIQLSNLTHENGTPWSRTVNEAGRQKPLLRIPNELIAECFIEYMHGSA